MALTDQILLLVVLLFLSGFFSGAEIALVSLSKAKAKHLLEQKRYGGLYVYRLKEDPQRMLATILIANNVANIAAAAITTSMAIQMFGNAGVGIATGVMTLLILIFGEITPKSIAANNNVLFSQIVAPPIWALSIVLAPILNILDAFLNRFLKLTGIKSKQGAITEEEIITMVKTAVEEGSIKEYEKELISNIFEFNDLQVDEIMVPRADMVLISANSTVDDALSTILKHNYSRLPVYDKHKDNIVGIVYLKDLIRHRDTKSLKKKIAKVMKKPYFIPESKKISHLMRQFQSRKEQLAVVVNEHGAITGLATLEDVLEEIVGEIVDETEKDEKLIRKIGAHSWEVLGKTDVDELNEKLNLKIPEGEYDTLSGFLMHHSGKIPKKGETISYRNYTCTVEATDGHRITLVRIKKIVD